jgi:UDP-glucose 4-epimerase
MVEALKPKDNKEKLADELKDKLGETQLAAADPRARGQTLNVVDGPGERIWSYLFDYMRYSNQPGWRVPIPYWLAIWIVRLIFATVFRRATKVPSILIPNRLNSRLKPLRFGNRRLRVTLGWTPPLDYQQCLARTYGPPGAERPVLRPSRTASSR